MATEIACNGIEGGRRSFLLLLMIFHAWSHGFADGTFSPSADVELDTYPENFNMPPVIKTIKSGDGDVIDCVDIYKQPAFDHPSLANHTIQMEPSSYPNGVRRDVSSVKFPQLWHRNGRCPHGTIPIRRTRKSDLLRASSLRSYGKKYPHGFSTLNFTGSLLGTSLGHEHAMAYVNKGKYYGAKASLNVWNPKVMNPYEFSLAQIWVTSNANGDFNTVEAGWMVSPVTFGDYRTRLFIYWTADNYQSTGCYNLRCAGFVQTSNEIALGTVVIPISIYGGKQFSLSIHIYKDKITGNWWLQINNKLLGYWPGTLFKGLADSSNLIEWGGEIMNSREEGQHTKTQMGSGHFPNEEWSKSNFIKNIQVVDASYSLRDPDNSLTPYAEYPTCYDIKVVPNKKSDYGYYLYFGGPGQSPTCP